MKRRKSPWFAFYVDDYSGGTRTMSLAAKGAFVDLLGYQFQNGSVPDDDRLICRILGCLPAEWEDVRAEVMAKFDPGPNGLINHRMCLECLERESYREKAAANGRKGGRPRKTEPFSVENRTLSENETQKKASTSTSTSTSSSESPPPATTPDKKAASRPLSCHEVEAYAKELGMPASDGTAFWDAKEGNGWKNGRNPVKDWRATFRNWKSNGYHPSQKGLKNGKPAVPVYKPKDGAPSTLPPDYWEIDMRRRAKESKDSQK